MFDGLTIGQFIPGDSLIHRLDPRTKIVTTILLVAAVMLAGSWPAYLVLSILLLAVFTLAGIPPGMLWQNLRPFWFILGITFLLQIFFTPGEVVFTAGPLHVTRPGLALGGQILWRLTVLILAGFLLTATTSPLKLTAGLECLLAPGKRFGVPAHELAMMMTIALRFIPTLFSEAQTIMKAQQSRGADFMQGGLWGRVRGIVPLLLPLFAGAFRRAEDLATAMESRCYRGGAGRTRMEELSLRGIDFGALILCVALFSLILGLRWRGW
ncbi:energy-coupling factor transporter transmembrane component T family protein [Desulfotomaculum copahuensis]|uniref:Transporter n=1 Tax=Desulfotomaculum copahuensis TaxID=1838280 RepID=A0A1B7LDJ4_9FIRM|nr:energy-coupling factor transporter transmembrane component T [Desulfotomaculum copahuensis]OAT81175.1 transporter [Desulfotomaculum copahuensis]